jgi:hypothetical protein
MRWCQSKIWLFLRGVLGRDDAEPFSPPRALRLMPGISPEALAGYILEEMLAYLVRHAGYRLLTDASQDPLELANQHHGLVVHGRGADHQVDVLGELLWIPAFTYPLRLILEAKCRKGKTDIGTVRGMVAALLDINQNNMPNRVQSAQSMSVPLRPKYSYVGAIFSSSGFSAPAADFALAHAVSLIDLSASQFDFLVGVARECGAGLSAYYKQQETRSAAGYVKSLRDILRSLFQNGVDKPQDQMPLITGALPVPSRIIDPVIRAAQEINELFIGMACGPYMLVLKAEDPHRFLEYATARPTHRIDIHWSTRHDNGQTWTIVPADHAQSYRLYFRLPEQLSNWIFGAENVRRTALAAKETVFSSITIYRKGERGDQLLRLTYDPLALRQSQL